MFLVCSDRWWVVTVAALLTTWISGSCHLDVSKSYVYDVLAPPVLLLVQGKALATQSPKGVSLSLYYNHRHAPPVSSPLRKNWCTLQEPKWERDLQRNAKYHRVGRVVTEKVCCPFMISSLDPS